MLQLNYGGAWHSEDALQISKSSNNALHPVLRFDPGFQHTSVIRITPKQKTLKV